jgi:CRP-like cAMP-binding protein/thioredoxin reductase
LSEFGREAGAPSFGTPFDVVIVGGGPAGLAAAAHAEASRLRYVLLERTDHLADTVYSYQKGKYVMAEPAPIPARSTVPFAVGSRESILGAWNEYARSRRLAVRYQQELVGLERQGDGFLLRTQNAQYPTRKVVLAIGTQGNQRQLGAPGEELPHVSYRLVDPDELAEKAVVVVGAGDSALEVALALCERNRVYLVVRRPEIVRGKESLAREIDRRRASGQIEVLFSTTVKRIVPGGIELVGPQADLVLAVDQVFLKIGTQPPRKLLEGFGVEFASPDPEAKPVLSAVYESSVPGLFLIGAITGRDLIKLGMNQGHEVIEHLLGRAVVPADEEILTRRLPFWTGTARERIIQLMDELPLFGAVAELADPTGRPSRVSPERRQAATSEQLREVFLAAEPRTYKGGDVVMAQDDYTDSVLALVAGSVEIRRRDDSGAETKLAVLQAGTFIGEMGLISGRRRNATAIAVGEVQAIEVPRKAMLRLVYSSPAVKRMMDTTFLVRALQNYLFPQIPMGELWPLVARTKVERVDKNQVLFREGDPGDSVYIIRNGQVKLSKTSGDRELVIAYLVAGSVFGESALLGGGKRSVTVSTIFPSELISLQRKDFDAFVGRFPGLRAGLERKLEADRLATLKEEATPGAGRVLSELIREEVVMGTDALIIDEYRCVRCSNCIRACEDVHDDGQARLSLTGVTFANILAPNSCWQCENPLCMLDCPPDALYRDRRGEIHIRENCIGCGNCESNCPYGNIFMVHPKPKTSLFGWLTSMFKGEDAAAASRTVAVKCDLCATNPGGPACVRSCPTGAAIRVKPQDYQRTIERLIVQGGKGH